MKTVAVLGGGVVGLTTVSILKWLIQENYLKDISIDLVSNDIGGDYLKGGLKYLHHNNNVQRFITECLGIDESEFYLNAVRGAICIDNTIYPYPEYLLKLNANSKKGLADKIQKLHWDKTRIDGIFNITSMNDPWSNDYEFEIKFIGGLSYFVDNLKSNLDGVKIIKDIVDNDKLDYILKHYDLVIYTLPSNLIIDYLKVPVSYEYTNLNVFRYNISDAFLLNKLWWNYIYFPESIYPFHRISKANATNSMVDIDVEVNSVDKNLNQEIYNKTNKKFCDLFYDKYNVLNMDILLMNFVQIKGHLKTNLELQNYMPDNLILLGRFAQADSRMTLDKVINNLYADNFNIFKRLK